MVTLAIIMGYDSKPKYRLLNPKYCVSHAYMYWYLTAINQCNILCIFLVPISWLLDLTYYNKEIDISILVEWKGHSLKTDRVTYAEIEVQLTSTCYKNTCT